jgi:hypothetical protein
VAIKQSITPQEVVDFLNEFIATDPKGAGNFLRTRVEINTLALRDAKSPLLPFVDGGSITPMGLLNAVFGVFDEGKRKDWGPICYTMKDGSRITEASLVRNDDGNVAAR